MLAFQNSKDRNQAQDAIEHNLDKANLTNSKKDRKIWNIPACYEDSYALDRELIQATHGLSKEEVISNTPAHLTTPTILASCRAFLI